MKIKVLKKNFIGTCLDSNHSLLFERQTYEPLGYQSLKLVRVKNQYGCITTLFVSLGKCNVGTAFAFNRRHLSSSFGKNDSNLKCLEQM
jgi:hypothetical protein